MRWVSDFRGKRDRESMRGLTIANTSYRCFPLCIQISTRVGTKETVLRRGLSTLARNGDYVQVGSLFTFCQFNVVRTIQHAAVLQQMSSAGSTEVMVMAIVCH